MPSNPLLSIITVTYNAEHFINTCIEKLQAQTFKNFEHIIVDGASTDNTLSIVLDQQKLHNNIALISEPDKGIYDAMNKGINASRGEWIFFLGADDYFYTNTILEEVEHYLTGCKYNILYGNVWYQKLNKIYDGEFDIEKILKHNICHQSIFYNQTVFKLHGQFNLKYKQEADYEFNLRCWLQKRVIHQFIPYTIAFYSDGGNSSFARDTDLVKDYPKLITHLIASSRDSVLNKIKNFAIAYRKILLRYNFVIFKQTIFCTKGHRMLRIMGAFFLFFSLPIVAISKK